MSQSDHVMIAFFEKEPSMSVELLPIVRNLKGVYYNDDFTVRLLRDKGYCVAAFGDKDLLGATDDYTAVEAMLDDSVFLSNVLPTAGKTVVSLFFFTNDRIHKLNRRAGFVAAIPPYEIRSTLGNKLFVPELCGQLGLTANPSVLVRGPQADENFALCLAQLGLPIVAQGASGISGEDTFLVQTESEFNAAYASCGGTLRASRYIESPIPISIHLCIGRDEVSYVGPMVQLIGFPELSSNRFQYAGTDTNQSMFCDDIKQRIERASRQVGLRVQELGYRGILGLDFLWNRRSGDIYLQELNTRFVGTTRLVTGIERLQRIVPTIVHHILEFTEDMEIIGDIGDVRAVALDKAPYALILINNNLSTPVIVRRYLEPGIYKRVGGGIRRKSDSLFLSDLEQDELLIVFCEYQGSVVEPAGYLVRLILAETALQHNKYSLREPVIELIESVRRQLLSA